MQKVVAGANAIADFPYVFGGGHASFVDNAYDCSGSVSYALAPAGLLSSPETSGELESWGAPGPGRYITVYANAGHTYMYVDGILYDTAGRSGVYASRWQVWPWTTPATSRATGPACRGRRVGAWTCALLHPARGPRRRISQRSNTAIAVISVVSIISGYLLLAALWHFVFREKARDRRRKRLGLSRAGAISG